MSKDLLPIEEINRVFERLAIEELEEEPEEKGSLQYEVCDLSSDKEMLRTHWSVFDYADSKGVLSDYISGYFGDDKNNRLLLEAEKTTDTRGILGVRPQIYSNSTYGLISEEQEDNFIQIMEEMGYEVIVPVNQE